MSLVKRRAKEKKNTIIFLFFMSGIVMIFFPVITLTAYNELDIDEMCYNKCDNQYCFDKCVFINNRTK